MQQRRRRWRRLERADKPMRQLTAPTFRITQEFHKRIIQRRLRPLRRQQRRSEVARDKFVKIHASNSSARNETDASTHRVLREPA